MGQQSHVGWQVSSRELSVARVQGDFAHKKHPPPRTLQYDSAHGPMVALGGVAVSYERGTPPGSDPSQDPSQDSRDTIPFRMGQHSHVGWPESPRELSVARVQECLAHKNRPPP